MKLIDHIPIGKADAISMAEVSRMFNIPERAVRMEILKARIAGELICSDESGYYLPANEFELRSYVGKVEATIKTSRKALKAFKKALRG